MCLPALPTTFIKTQWLLTPHVEWTDVHVFALGLTFPKLLPAMYTPILRTHTYAGDMQQPGAMHTPTHIHIHSTVVRHM